MRIKLFAAFFMLIFPLGACGMSSVLHPQFAPSIDIANLSQKNIENLEISWNGLRTAGGRLYPGQGKSSSFQLRNLKDFYGPVRLSWENAAGRKFEKHFEFTEADMPVEYINRKKAHPEPYIPERDAVFVRFEFTQTGVEFYTSRAPGAWERTIKAGKIKNQIRKTTK